MVQGAQRIAANRKESKGEMMAMNKKEQAELDTAKRAVIVARALNWTSPVAPDLLVTHVMSEITGYLYNVHYATTTYARSSSIGHATSYDSTPKKITTQGSRNLYSTKTRALRALRHEVEKECAERLEKIDIKIQEEEAANGQ